MLNEKLRNWYSEHGVTNRLGPITMAMLISADNQSQNFPSLHGPGVKGASTKALAPFVRALCAELDDGDDFRHRRAKLAATLDDWYQIIGGAGNFLTRDEQQKLAKAVHSRLLNYQYLSATAISDGKLLWNTIPKHHYWEHLLTFSVSLNPRVAQTYSEESAMGVGAKCYKSLCFGPYERTIQVSFLRKYMLALQLDFAEHLWNEG